MVEIVLFVCSLVIIVPLLFLGALFVNFRRTLSGQPALTTEKAVIELFKESYKKTYSRLKEIFNIKSKASKTKTKKEEKKPDNFEDAEFRDVN
ncbi:MAG: hypothetical protein Q9M91_07620 [Candidatus Dojkabacteria bacterium]|nr:hypothetical protein [Candidatus Dojkabacteria bacterium]